jgi:hypothetical protein
MLNFVVFNPIFLRSKCIVKSHSIYTGITIILGQYYSTILYIQYSTVKLPVPTVNPVREVTPDMHRIVEERVPADQVFTLTLPTNRIRDIKG